MNPPVARPRAVLVAIQLPESSDLDHAQHLARLDGERDVVDRDERAAAARKLDAEVADFEQRPLAHVMITWQARSS